MRWAIAVAASLISAGAWAVPDSSAEWWEAIHACNAHVQAVWIEDDDAVLTLDESLNLETTCPQLGADFERHPLRSLLPQSAEVLTVRDPFGLQQLQDSYQRSGGGAWISPVGLDDILADLPNRVEEGASWWDRFVNWLDDNFGGESSTLPAWLRDFEVAEGVFDWILYLSIAAVVLLSLGIVLNEIAQHRKGTRRSLDPDSWQVAVMDAAQLRLEDVQAAPPGLRPGLMLQLIVQKLEQKQLVKLRAGMTHRSVVRATRTLPQQPVIARLATAAERARYGGWQPEAPDVEALTAEGEATLQDLTEEERS